MNAITKLNLIITNLLQKTQHDEFGAIDSLVLLKNQITSRVNELRRVHESSNPIPQDTPLSNSPQTLQPTVPITPTLEHATIQLFNSTLADIETSLLKNQNIRISNVPKNTKSFKPKLINQDQINHLEHLLQLMNFEGSDDYQLRNSYLKKLNMLYYTEMMAQQQTIKDIVSVVKDVESSLEIDSRWKKIDQITDDSLLEILGDFQKKIATLEREKLHMENEIIFLKERYNSFIDNKDSEDTNIS